MAAVLISLGISGCGGDTGGDPLSRNFDVSPSDRAAYEQGRELCASGGVEQVKTMIPITDVGTGEDDLALSVGGFLQFDNETKRKAAVAGCLQGFRDFEATSAGTES